MNQRMGQKRSVSLLLSAVLVLGICAVVPVRGDVAKAVADEVVLGDFYCELLNDGTVAITAYKGKETNVTVPATLSGYKVKRIGNGAFAENVSGSNHSDDFDEYYRDWVWDQTGVYANHPLYKEDYPVPDTENLGYPTTNVSTDDNDGGDIFNDDDDYDDDDPYDVGEARPPITGVKISYGIEEIGEKAFAGCSKLTTVDIPSSVTQIDDHAFLWCGSLKEITVPSSVSSIGMYAFRECENLTSASLQCPNIGICMFGGCRSLKTVTMSGKVRTIGLGAFWRCGSLSNLTIPRSVETIAEAAFYGCSALSSISVPNTVSTIKADAFSSCTALTSVSIPNSVKTIGSGAFANCAALSTATIASGVNKIGASAFDGTALTSITLPQSVTSIGIHAFGFKKGAFDEYVADVTFTVYGTLESAAERYATENGMIFVGKKATPTITANTTFTKTAGAKFKIGAKTDSDGKITYKSNKKGIATVNAKGQVVCKKAGTATITIKVAATDKYKAATKKIKVKVTKRKP